MILGMVFHFLATGWISGAGISSFTELVSGLSIPSHSFFATYTVPSPSLLAPTPLLPSFILLSPHLLASTLTHKHTPSTMAYHYSRDSDRRQPHGGYNYPSNYSNPSQYSIPDSVYSGHSTNTPRVSSPGGYHQQPSPITRAVNPAYYQPQPTASSMTSHDLMYGRPSPGPNQYGAAPADVVRGPGATTVPLSQQALYQPYPSNTDYSDEDKSFASTTHLVSPQKEWGVGSVVPVTTIPPVNQLPYQPYQAYPPRPSPSPTTPRGGTSHWHAMRKQLLERRVIKQIPLHNGNLVMDVPVPKGVIPSTKGLGVMDGEMDSMRYSAATCDPDDFMGSKFSLRQYLYGRKTELFVSAQPEMYANYLDRHDYV